MPDADEGAVTTRLLGAVEAVANELHPGRAGPNARLDSQLDRDLGFDSLGRVELVGRLERTFSVVLPERLAVEAETPRDLLRAIAIAPRPEAPAPQPVEGAAPAAAASPGASGAATWVDVLEWHAGLSPAFPCVRFYEDEAEGRVLTYGQLLAEARRTAAGLLQRGLQPGESVALMLPTGPQYFCSFFGVWLAGGVPVPVYPPFRPAQLQEHVRRQAGILDNSLAALLITTSDMAAVGGLLTGLAATLRGVTTPDDLPAAAPPVRPNLAAADTALLQYTSGSTAAPKGVILSHANLLANVRAMGTAVAVRPDDVMVSWLPLYHDMGLIGAWLGSLYHGLPLVLMSPLAFIARPARWLRAIHRYRGTLTAAPNFAFDLCVRRIADAETGHLDLSSLRGVYNGAEPVSPDTLRSFQQRFGPCGFRAEAMMPVYGLAENCVGLTFPPLGRGPVIDRVERRAMTHGGTAVPTGQPGSGAITFVSCGRPLPGHEVRVVDARDRELPDRREGRVQFRGPSATSGYFRNPQATAALFHDGWLDTGDLGYIAEGELYVTGRAKDIIIKAGRNIYPEELEAAVGDIPGVRRGNVAVFGVADEAGAGEKLVVVAETRKTAAEERRRVEQAIAALAVDLTGMPADRVVLAPPNTILKTSSGKIRRAACRRLFEEGMIGRHRKAAWRQVAALRLAALGPRLGRLWGTLRGVAYAAYAWLVIGILAPVGWLAMVLLPGRERRWRAARMLLKTAAALTGTAVVAKGIENVPHEAAAVLVANHASYLDGFVLTAVLDRPVAFVAKAELGQRPATALPLRRLGTVFVERFDRAKGVADAHGLLTRRDALLLFFPEGTFTRMPGVLPFHMGAFVTAAAADLAVVPIAVRGTRSMLRADSWFPRPGTATVVAGTPLRADPAAGTWEKALWLRDAARAHILRHSGEPDLAQERSPS